MTISFLLILGLIFLFLVGIGLVYFNPNIQTFLAKKAADYYSRELKTKVSIGKIQILDLHKLNLTDLQVQDQHKDSLLYIGNLQLELLDFKNLDLKNHKIAMDHISIDTLDFYIKGKSPKGSNLDFLIQYFGSGKPSSNHSPYSVSIDHIDLKNLHLRYLASNPGIIPPNQINYNDVDLNSLNVKIKGFQLKNQEFTGKLESMSFIEKSGFRLNQFQGKFSLNSRHIFLSTFLLITPNSHLGNQLSMYFKSWDDFDDFNNRIWFKTNIRNSFIDSRDINYFTSALKKIQFKAKVSGNTKGRINELEIRDLAVQTEKNTLIEGDYNTRNLEDLEKAYIESKNLHIQSNREDISHILNQFGYPQVIAGLPQELSDLNQITLSGAFEGEVHRFHANFKAQTNLGDIAPDLVYSENNKGVPNYRGTIQSQGFSLGKILGEPDLGKINLTTRINGRGFGAQTFLDTLETNIHSLEYHGYQYQNIFISGSQHQKAFAGRIFIRDPNLILGFKGLIDFNGKMPIFNFKADIEKADLRKLGFVKDSLQLRTFLDLSFTGNSLSNLNGKILATHTTLTKGSKVFGLDSILIGAEKQGIDKELFVKSCIADISIKGKFDLKNLPGQLMALLGKYLPSIPLDRTQVLKNQEFKLVCLIKDFTPISGLIDPDLFISSNTQIFGNFNSSTQILNFNGIAPSVSYGAFRFGPVILDAENVETGSLDINLTADSVSFSKSILARNINLSNSIFQDSLHFNLKVENVNSVNHLDLNGQVAINNTKAGLSILPSELVLESKVWKIENSFRILFEPHKTEIHGLSISHNNESLSLNGTLSPNQNDSLYSQFHNFDIKALNEIIKQYGFGLSGRLNGYSQFSSVLGTPSFSSHFKVDSLGLDGTLLGDAELDNVWDGVNSDLVFNGKINNKVLDAIRLKGKIGLSLKNDRVDAELNMDHAKAELIAPFTKGIVSNLKGSLSSKILVSGTRDKPILNGILNFNSTELTVDYLNTHYSFNDSIEFQNGKVRLNDLKLKDPYGRIATLNGAINFSSLSNPIFGVDLHAENFLALNTNEKQGDLYYGKAFSTGDFSFEGPLNQINIIIDAVTMPNTTLNIPLNKPNTIGNKDYITFVSIRDSINSAHKKKVSHKGITMDFNLNVTPSASVKLIFDEKIGDIIKGNGNSDLNLQLNSEGDFLMYGTFEIEKGDYLFTSQNILNKLFTIEKGGSIRFNGDPYKAEIDLFADYQARTTVTELYQAANRIPVGNSTNYPTLVNCNIHLSGTLSEPTFSFALKFPLTPYIEQDLATYLSSKEVITTQSMLFLVSNQFNGTLDTKNGIGIATSTGVQFVSNQLSNILNNFSNRLDINIRSLNEFGLVYRNFSNRLQLSGNLSNIGAQSANYNPLALNNNTLTGDAEIAYNLNKSGSLRVKGFYRLVPIDFIYSPGTGVFLEPPTTYTQGMGILFQKEFSSLKDLLGKKPKPKPKTSSRQSIREAKNKLNAESPDIPKKVEFREIKN